MALNALPGVSAAGGVTVTAPASGQAGAEVNPWLVTFNVAGARTDIMAASSEQEGVSRNPWFIRFNETGDQDIVTPNDQTLRNFVYEEFAGNDTLSVFSYADTDGQVFNSLVEYGVAQPRDLAVFQDYTRITGLNFGGTLSITGVDNLNVYMNQGDDTVNVGGTTAQTLIWVGGGNNDE